MEDLNKSTSGSSNGWTDVAFWSDSFKFWTNSKAVAISEGDTNAKRMGEYNQSIKLAEKMINYSLSGRYVG